MDACGALRCHLVLSVGGALQQWRREGLMQDTQIEANGVNSTAGEKELASPFLSFCSPFSSWRYFVSI